MTVSVDSPAYLSSDKAQCIKEKGWYSLRFARLAAKDSDSICEHAMAGEKRDLRAVSEFELEWRLER